METIAFSEVDKYAIKVLEKNLSGVPNLGDITKSETWPDLGRVDLLTGGFPCQPFSCAGKRRGKKDDRHLWPAMRRVVQRYRPAWMLGENVPGIIPMELDSVLSDLEGLGYACQTLVIPACAVDAKHRRSRIWVVANSNCAGLERIYKAGRGIDMQSTEADLWRIRNPRPRIYRRTHGISKPVDRLRGLGNAIVPQVAYELMRMIMEVEYGRHEAGSLR